MAVLRCLKVGESNHCCHWQCCCHPWPPGAAAACYKQLSGLCSSRSPPAAAAAATPVCQLPLNMLGSACRGRQQRESLCFCSIVAAAVLGRLRAGSPPVAAAGPRTQGIVRCLLTSAAAGDAEAWTAATACFETVSAEAPCWLSNWRSFCAALEYAAAAVAALLLLPTPLLPHNALPLDIWKTDWTGSVRMTLYV